ncbi:hypothetical protein AWE51_17305 [Aquimarina aggregata]|uniref:Bacteriocin n=1 Tax=Aquimarina aggregata TaxID=1642818 RepID=A0A162WX45_9FLAO|nr:hypothetical protein [Aquimarina aggregata]KZS38315.1 hypothetical protein AWE51_17305 [Aquimarina aggregata]
MLKGILNLEGAKELNRKELTTLKGGFHSQTGGGADNNAYCWENGILHPCKEDESEDDKA